MKKFFLSFFVILSFALYTWAGKIKSESSNQVAVNVPAPTTTSASIPNDTPASRKSNYKDGSYTGAVADAYYGPFQVKAIISGGKLTDVQFLQYPNDRGNSISINREAMPYLKQEAIATQNAEVDIVTGATQSSEAFKVSLKSALDQATI